VQNSCKRVTTDYNQNEDRISFSCVLTDDSSIVVWLSQRLLRRFVPALLHNVEKELKLGVQSHTNMQNVADRMGHKDQSTVPSVHTTTHEVSWVMVSIDISRMPQGVRLTFKGANGELAPWSMSYVHLRQWLAILYRCCVKSEWPLDVWKEWQQIISFESETSSDLWH
jgi:hypothetical protein